VEGTTPIFFLRFAPDRCPPLSRHPGAPTFRFVPASLCIPISHTSGSYMVNWDYFDTFYKIPRELAREIECCSVVAYFNQFVNPFPCSRSSILFVTVFREACWSDVHAVAVCSRWTPTELLERRECKLSRNTYTESEKNKTLYSCR